MANNFLHRKKGSNVDDSVTILDTINGRTRIIGGNVTATVPGKLPGKFVASLLQKLGFKNG
ncbi:MAG TPA: hypothetical protein VGQ09_19410 [Chitinophagaceae bacterium]|jgi:hypothetical protein|nr:hypothetical protein [Chitinophagaceae bacterium]